MNGTMKRLLSALGAALMLAGAGCAVAPGDPGEDDDVSEAVQPLDEVDSEGSADGDEEQDDADDGAPGPPAGHAAGAQQAGEHPATTVVGPDPLPWTERGEDDDEDRTTAPHTAMTHSGSGAPSGGTGGK